MLENAMVVCCYVRGNIRLIDNIPCLTMFAYLTTRKRLSAVKCLFETPHIQIVCNPPI